MDYVYHQSNAVCHLLVDICTELNFAPGPRSLLTLRPKYSPQHIHSQTVVAEVFPIMWENTFHTQQDAKL